MPKITNISPRGDLDVPLLRRVVKAGETVEVTAEQAGRLLAQRANFAAAHSQETATGSAAAAGKTSRRVKAPKGTTKSTDHSEVSS